MLYRAEVIKNGAVRVAKNFKATNVQQVVRRITESLNSMGMFLIVWILSASGTAWQYALKKLPDGTYKAKPLKKIEGISDFLVAQVFEGNKTIRSVV